MPSKKIKKFKKKYFKSESCFNWLKSESCFQL